MIGSNMDDEADAGQGNPGGDRELARCLSAWGVAVNSATMKVRLIEPKISNIGSVMSIDRYVAQLRESMVRHDSEWDKVVGLCLSKGLAYETYQERAAEIIADIDAALGSLEDRRSAIVASSSGAGANDLAKTQPAPGSNVKMPVVTLPTFNGERAQWERFWSLFNDMVGKREDIPFSYKLSYLHSSLLGEAKHLIDGFPSTEEGYNNAIKFLCETFDNQKLYAYQVQNALLYIKSPRHCYEDLREFRATYQQQLRKLDIGSQHKDFLELVKAILTSKVTDETIKEVTTEVGIEYDYVSFDKALKRIISQFEFRRFRGRTPLEMKNKRPDRVAVNSTMTNTTFCAFCTERHDSDQCATFRTPEERYNQLRNNRRCLKCGKGGHYARECRARNCIRCQGGHWHLICNTRFDTNRNYSNRAVDTQTRSGPPGRPSGAGGSTAATSGARPYNGPNQFQARARNSRGPRTDTNVQQINVKNVTVSESVALPTGLVDVKGLCPSDKVCLTARAFFDSGSQRSFIHPDLVAELGLPFGPSLPVSVVTFGGHTSTVQCPTVTLQLRVGSSQYCRIAFIITDKVGLKVKVPGLEAVARCLERDGYRLDDTYLTDQIENVKILIGADNFNKFIIGTCKYQAVSLFKTVNGHIISGKITNQSPSEICTSLLVVSQINIKDMEIDSSQVRTAAPPDLSVLWRLESIGIRVKEELLNHNEQDVLLEFCENIQYNQGLYTVALPWKRDPEILPTNYHIARGQLASLYSKFVKDGSLHDQFKTILMDYHRRDFIETVDHDPSKGHFLPYHGVIKESATTPVRIVFNASAKSGDKAVSLNDCLETGPNLTEKLVTSLVRFRMEKFALMADISKAFLRIQVRMEDRKFLKFLWIEDLEQPHVITTYQFKRVLFGSTSSPFLLQGTLWEHFERHGGAYRDMLQSAFYVDNFITTTDTEEELFRTKSVTENILHLAGMPLSQWNSNCAPFNASLQEEDRDIVANVLGMGWNTESDIIFIKRPRLGKFSTVTKRGTLAMVSSIFDPLGLLSPLIMRGKFILRNMWVENCGWDEVLSTDYCNAVNGLVEDFALVEQFKFNRNCVNQSAELLVYCDASVQAYGAVAYAVEKGLGSNLVMSKGKLAPLKSRTIVELELLAVTIGCRLASYIMTLTNKFSNCIIYSDNSCCLAWIESCHSKSVFVKNRVAEINRLKEAFGLSFKHVRTERNPADLISRGASVQELLSSCWLGNVPVMTESVVESVQHAMVCDCYNVVEEVNVCTTVDVSQSIICIDNFSNLNKLILVITRVFQFISKASRGRYGKGNPVHYLIRVAQQEGYPVVYSMLTTSGKGTLEAQNLIRSLRLYPDSELILRSAGRLQHARTYSRADPVLLPKGHHLTELFARRAHERTFHGGLPATLSHLRRTYWVPQGRQLCKRIVARCVKCRRTSGATFDYPSAPPLPAARVNWTRPFSHAAIDLTGLVRVVDH